MGVAPTRLIRHALPWRLAPEAVALLVRDDLRPFALIGEWAGGGALIGSEPVRIAGAGEDPFDLLDQQPTVSGAPAGAVGGGWVGYVGYDLGRRLEPVGASPPPPRRLPAFELCFYDHLLRADADGRWWFEALWTDGRAPALRRRHAELVRRGGGEPPRRRPFATAPWTARPAAGGHALAVDAARERIRAGDVYQANICRRLGSRLTGEAIDLFAAAVPRLRPGRAAFLAGPWGAVASLSPELFLARRGRAVRSAPIKGTARRSRDPAAAEEAGSALVASGKDRAENVMIVDLVRNDLGRVCRPGSIAVPVLAERQAHTGVWHLVSEVTGVLRAEVGDGDLLRASFPPGSVTGAPKIAAMEVIAELESSPREVYTGAIGFASPVAGLELSVAIRTFEFHGDEAWLGVGGGIVADSDSAAELAECETKAQPLLAAIGGRLASPPPSTPWLPAPPAPPLWPASDGVGATRPAAPRPRRLGARPVSRPDPRDGVFETILARAGRPVAPELHLARLAASVGALYGRVLPADLGSRVAVLAAAQPEAGRLRISVRPVAGGPLDVSLVATRLPAGRPPVRLQRMAVAGGLGAHKWCDRGLLDALTDAVAPEQPLICDLDGELLETGRANLFAVRPDGVLITPAVAGRLLPGVTRGRVMAAARRLGIEVRSGPLGAEHLWRAREVFVTGALGGIEPVESCDSRELAAGPGDLTDRLARILAADSAALAGDGPAGRPPAL